MTSRTLRVDDPELARVLRSRLGSGVTVRVEPTPEIDAVIRDMARRLGPGDDRHYVEGGRVTPEAVGRYFEAAAAVYRLTPWEIVQSGAQVLRLDAPPFGVGGACVIIIGGLGENYGVCGARRRRGNDPGPVARRAYPVHQVEEYLLEYFPAMGAIPFEDSEGVPEYLDAFFGWLGDAGGESPAAAREIRERIARKRPVRRGGARRVHQRVGQSSGERSGLAAPAENEALGMDARFAGSRS